MAVTLTPRAAQRVRNYLDKRGHGLGLRVGVKKTGCSGWAYVIDYADDGGKTLLGGVDPRREGLALGE